MIKTEEELKQEWGQERFVNALANLSEWYLDKAHPISQKQMLELQTKSRDAFELFASRTYYLSFRSETTS